MSSMSEDIQCAGSDTRPPMLDRTDFESWQQRIRLYCLGKDNGENIMKSINEGPFHMGTVSDVIAGGTEGAVQQGPVRARVLNDLSAEEKERYKADIRATNILLQGIPKDIYSLINHYTDAKDIWENVKMILEGSELTKDDRESQLYDEFEHFRQIKGETIQGYYVRFTKLINDMRNIKMTMPRMQLNSKFVNNMLPEWSRFITEVKLNRGLKESNFDQLYAYLKQHEVHANENRIMMERFIQPNNDPLALVSNASVQQYPTQSSKSPQSSKEPYPADNFQLDSGSSSTENLIESLSNSLALLTQSYKSHLPQTNNQLRTSSNARNKAMVQDGKVVVQDVRGRYNANNQGRPFQRNNARGNGVAGNVGGLNRGGIINPGPARPIKCYNCNGLGHIARECPRPKRLQDSDYFKDKMLLMQAQENGAVLDEEQSLFLAGEQVTNFDDDVDNSPENDLALNMDHVFEADECDAFDSDVDEGPTTQTMFMANLTSEDPIYDEAGPSYDSNTPFEVQGHNTFEYHEVHEMQSDVQHNYVVDSVADYTSDSNIIPYDQYVEDNEEYVVQSNVSSVRNDALISILDEMHEQGVQSRVANKPDMVVNDSVTSELARYKELVGEYEKRAKFELTDRERKIDEQMRIIISDRNRKETSLKSELHSAQILLSSTVDHYKSKTEEVTLLKKDFKQKEDKFLEEFLDIKMLKDKLEDRLYKQDQSVQTVHMLCKPKSFYDEKHKVAIGYKNPLCLTRAKQTQSALYNGHVLVTTNHTPTVVHDSEDTHYSKENLLATFAPQRNLTPEQIFWSIDNNDRKKAETSVPKPLSALTVYPPNTPVKLVPRVLPTKSQVKINLYVLTQLFTEFDKTCKKRITPTGVTEGERGFEQTKRCYLTEVIPFFKTLKEHFAGVQTALFKEVKVMEEIFDQMNDEVDQNTVDKQCAEIERKNLLIANENLIANCLSNQLLYDVEKSRCLDLEAEMSKVHNELKHISKLERENINLQLKYQHLQESFDNKKSQAPQEAPDFHSFFKIKNLEHQIQEKDNVIRDLKVLVSNVNDRSCEPSNAKNVTALLEQNERFRVEIEKVKQHYKEMFKSITITRASTNEKTSSLLTQIEDLKAQLEGNLKVATRSSVKTKVLAPGMYAIDVEPIPPRLKNNRSAHLVYINHLKESVETVREIVEEARIVKPLDSALTSACQYTKRSQELVEYVIGTCPKEFTGIVRKSGTDHLMVFGLRLFKTYDGESLKVQELCEKVHQDGNNHVGTIMGYGDYMIGDSVVSRAYYVEGLGHNLFSVGQFYDSDLEIAFRKHSCFVRDMNSEDLGLAPSPVPATTYIPPIDKDLEILFQPMFDEYFDQSTDSELVPTATVVNAPIVSTNTSVSTTIAQDAPSTSHSLSSSQVHPPVFPQGVAAGPTIEDTSITQADLHPSVNPVAGEPGSAQSTSGDVSLAEPNQVTQSFLCEHFCDSDLEVAFRKHTCFVRDIKGTDILKGVGIFHQKSVPRTPQQNGVVERRNRTLVEAARTMMISEAPMFSRAKMLPLLKPDLHSSMYLVLCAILQCLRKSRINFQAKADIGIFIGCSTVYILVYNDCSRMHRRQVASSSTLIFIIQSNIQEIAENPLRDHPQSITMFFILHKNLVSGDSKSGTVQGISSEEGIDFEESVAPGARIEDIRIFIANERCRVIYETTNMINMIYQMDVQNCFLKWCLQESKSIWQQPEGFLETRIILQSLLMLKKDLYGL
ncbi:retrovirus-related pol polyprotein from transposon TNT 1-94 [Tanacetum coccineum]